MKFIFTFFLTVAFWCQPLWAAPNGSDSSEMAALFDLPCRVLDIPQPVALAIAKVESDFQPWALNIEGRSFRFASREEVLSKAKEARAAGRSFDIGLMQVNDWWLRKYGLSLEAALDPLANIYLGGWILKQELERHGGETWAAVGAYHSPNPVRANRYAAMVFSAVKNKPLNQAAPPPKPVAGNRTVSHPAAAMRITFRQKILAQGQGLKASAAAAVNSMKVKYEN